jgi:hypothetical protein
VAIWNSLPGVTPAKKFKDRTTATSRIWERIQGLGESEKPKGKAQRWRTGCQGRARESQCDQEGHRR